MTTIDVQNPSQILAILREAAANYPTAIAEAMWQEGRLIMNESRKQCPVDTGDLKGSSLRYPQVEADANSISLKLGYHTKYAVYVHERLDLYHHPPTKAKFLEDPIRARSDKFMANVAQRVIDSIGAAAGAVVPLDVGSGNATATATFDATGYTVTATTTPVPDVSDDAILWGGNE